MKKRTLFIIVVLIVLSKNLIAQDSKEERLSNFIEEVLEAFPVIPGVSIAISNNNETLYTNGFGKYDIENNFKCDSNTNFYIASTTKSFVGLLAALLDNEGKINLNEQITSYKPFKNFSNTDLFKNITVLDLITHQSGIDNHYLSFLLAYSGDYTNETILKLIEEETFKNEKGKAFAYSNFGYYLFDVLIKEELGLSWKGLLHEKVFKPLDMQNTTAYISRAKNVAKPYISVFPEQLKTIHLQKSDATMHAAGGLVSNANDIGKFLSFFLSKGMYNNETLVSKELIESTYAKHISAAHDGIKVFDGKAYGKGWRIGNFNKYNVIYHFGGYSGYYSHLSFLPEQNLGVAVFINHEFGLPVANLIANYTYDLYLGNDSNLKKHEKTLEKKLPKLLKSAQKSQVAHEKKQAARRWELSLEKQNYIGHYYNEKFGTAIVTFNEDKNYIEIGNLKAVCTPFPQLDTMRVELIPNSGTVIKFIIENNEAISISYGGEIFKKQK
ncbi:serine hydrolase domain-containing protein [uncultured Psychroserpens sp.]|uniref:serine hydrolase domain-containing protein n=1 Tax=uncultured Psychroserpens sp. TaxID=255436 RepID=UPI00260930DB|nr:serine hydrolase domain-containing protein [uncultured Psychroserpens sp.]